MDSGTITLPLLGQPDTTIFDAAADGGGCTTYVLTNLDPTNVAMVRVSGLHSLYFPIQPGQIVPFRLGKNGLTKIVGHSSSASATLQVAGGVESRL